MTTVDFLELDHSRMKMVDYDGVFFPEHDEPISEHLSKIKAMEIRDDDIFLCSFPKSGTHWIYRVIDMLQRGQAKFIQRNTDSTFIDLQNIEAMSHLTSPRVLVTHLPFQYLPSQLQGKRTKIVHMYRNPQAVLVSFYFQLKNAEEGFLQDFGAQTLDKMTDWFFSKEVMYSGWFKYMDSVKNFKTEHPQQPIFDVSYEDMTQYAVDTVSRLGQFLGLGPSAELCADIVEACSFQNQKSIEEKADPNQAPKFFRKGDMNDWKNHMTVAVHEKFQQILEERANNCQYSINYCGE